MKHQKNLRKERTAPPEREIETLIALFGQKKLPVVIERATVLVGQFPNDFALHNLLGAAYTGLGRFEEAVASYRRATEIAPNQAGAHINLGHALKRLGRFKEAVGSYRRALKFKPNDANTHTNLGATLREQGRLEKAIASCRRAITIDPGLAAAHNNLGVALSELDRLEEAVPCYRRAIEIDPDFDSAHNNLGAALRGLGRAEEAVASYRCAIRLRPNFLGALINFGNTLKELGRLEEAVKVFRRAIEVNPGFADAYVKLGSALRRLGRVDEAVASYRRAIDLNPNFADAHLGLGIALEKGSHLESAVASFGKAVEVQPDHAEALSHLMFYRANICDWTGRLPDDTPKLGVSTDPVSPFHLLSFDDNPNHHFRRSQNYARRKLPRAKPAAFDLPRVKPDRLRVGYFSADFRDHAVMYLAARLFELHDRDRFEISAYSYGPDKEDEMRSRIRESVELFHDVREKSDRQIADLARGVGLDIAVDLTGYTGGGRLGIFSKRAAPVQIAWLGFPGTTGTEFMDYVISDPVVIPEEARRFFSERILYLPHTYQANDDQRVISSRTFSRSELGLPETGFVFCCFNNNYKITPREFDIWMRLLAQIEGSVLWLLKSNRWAETNLREEAGKRGIDPVRLVFAERVPLAQHLARHRNADLFLDTFNYNAHTTASDALWAGLPLVTKMGEGFAARVAASLLSAIGLDELITVSEQAYEQLALDLATHPDKLQAIRHKLAANRNSKPLFDSELFTRHIERGYVAAYERFFAGQKPTTIHIPE